MMTTMVVLPVVLVLTTTMMMMIKVVVAAAMVVMMMMMMNYKNYSLYLIIRLKSNDFVFSFYFISRTRLRKDMFSKHRVFKKLLQPTNCSLLRIKPMWLHR